MKTSTVGQQTKRRIRYAVVGLGWIAQESVLPAFQNASKNSELVALVTGDLKKGAGVGKQYGISRIVSYDDFDELMRSGEVDAVYLAVPNNLHCDFTVRAAQAGVHVLCEKPMASSAKACETMTRACKKHGVKLMIAYRLHFEPGNLKAIETVMSGRIGEPRIFTSTFGQQSPAGNIRLKKELDGGPLMDLGVYCINAARYLFRAEPAEVIAFGASAKGDPRFKEVHEMASVVMKFPDERLASFTSSLGSSDIDSYTVVGTKGSLRIAPGYGYHGDRELFLKVGKKESKQTFKQGDEFGPELLYFSNCILNNEDPEPGGAEGAADLRVVQAILKSLRSGRPVKVQSGPEVKRPNGNQKIQMPPVKPRRIIGAASPS